MKKKLSILLLAMLTALQFGATTTHASPTAKNRWLKVSSKNSSRSGETSSTTSGESASLSNSPTLKLRSKTSTRKKTKSDNSNTAKIDVWQTLRQSNAFPMTVNSRISSEKAQYLKHKAALKSTMNRAEPYIYTIIDELKRRNMPVELALLPLIESAYNPKANSSARAVGLWQIMSGTAATYNKSSTKTSFFEPRKDFIESTNIALNLLQAMNKQFNGDWLLTLAAYNAGDGRVGKAIRENKQKNLPTDFWSLDLPKETKQYVPRMLALIDIVKNNRKYGFTLPVFNSQNRLVKINIDKQIKLKTVAELTGMNLDKLLTYNAGYVKQVTQPKGTHYLMVPASYAELVNDSLSKQNYISDELLASNNLFGQDYTAQNSDSAPTNKPLDIKSIKVNDAAIRKIAENTKLTKPNNQFYIVKKGDTLSNIAKKYNISLMTLRQWNNLGKRATIKIGTKLLIKK